MTDLSPLTEEEKRRRRARGVVQDGEVIGFDMAFMDSSPRTAIFLNDSEQLAADAAYQRSKTALNDWRRATSDTPPPPPPPPKDLKDAAACEKAALQKANDRHNGWRNEAAAPQGSGSAYDLWL